MNRMCCCCPGSCLYLVSICCSCCSMLQLKFSEKAWNIFHHSENKGTRAVDFTKQRPTTASDWNKWWCLWSVHAITTLDGCWNSSDESLLTKTLFIFNPKRLPVIQNDCIRTPKDPSFLKNVSVTCDYVKKAEEEAALHLVFRAFGHLSGSFILNVACLFKPALSHLSNDSRIEWVNLEHLEVKILINIL